MDTSSVRAHTSKLLKRLDAAAAKLVEEFHDDEFGLDFVATTKSTVEKYIRAYEAGTPFFDREVLIDLSRQIDAVQAGEVGGGGKHGEVRILDPMGGAESRPLAAPYKEADKRDVFIIIYSVCQYVTHMPRSYFGCMEHAHTPITIGHGPCAQPSGWRLEDLQEAFQVLQAEWVQSDTCKSLAAILESAQLSTPIYKIVCFGLGCLDALEKTTREDLHESIKRSATQYAAALTMAEVLSRRAEIARKLSCYTQDPVHTGVERRLLASLGFTVLADPKGFLEVDSNTLVFSVTPNVPVRQILVDVQWPAAMVWNTVDPDREDPDANYRRVECDDGSVMLISPWTTDESSSRVRDMVKHYDTFPFPGDGKFSDLSVYLKRGD